MKFLRNFSIRIKLILLVFFVTLISLTVGITIDLLKDLSVLKKDLLSNLELEAKLVADYSVPALLFDDKKGAEAILQKFRVIPSVVNSSIYDPDGNIYATYIKDGYEFLKDMKSPDSKLLKSKKLCYLSVPVKSEEEVLGTISVFATTERINERVINHVEWMVSIFLGSMILALILISSMEILITGPLIKLSKAALHIRETGNFKVRVAKESNDEVGILIDSFNELLGSLEDKKRERDEAEKALLEERENLEMRVLERTRELTEAKEKAEESDRLKSAFISNFSHEIRTPLNAIIGFTNLLLEENLDDKEKEYALESLNNSKDNLLKTVENIFEISNIDSGQLRLSFSEVNINTEVMAAVKQADKLIKTRKDNRISITTSISNTDGIKIITDPRRLKQVLGYLLDNSVKFTDKGIIEVGTYFEDSETICFYVKDTGPGIPENKSSRIFERFYKIQSKEVLYDGAGLGLAVAKGIVEAMKGKIWFESKEGFGSTFYFTLPVLSDDLKKGENYFTLSKIKLKGKKVLIAEDSFSNYAYLAEVLKLNHMETVNAKNGVEAYYLAKEHDYDLILMDILMPEMDGIDTAKKIKKIKPNIPIIAQTAVSISETEEDIKGLFDAYLLKPILINELISVITKVLEQKKNN